MRKLLQKYRNISYEVRASVAYTMCSVLQNCLSFITLPLFTRLLTTEEYGQYSIYASWMGILSIFVTLNIQYGSFSTAMMRFEDNRKEYISSAQSIMVMLAMIFMLAYLPFRAYWNPLFHLPTFLIVLMVAEIISQAALMCWSNRQRFEHKYRMIIFITLVNSIIAPVLAYLFVTHSESKGYARILGYSLVNIMIGGSFFIYNYMAGKKVYSKKYWSYILEFNIPLVVYYLSQVVFNQSDRIMIDHMCGTDKAGIYGVAYSLAMVLSFVLNAINNSFVPWLYERLKDGKTERCQSVSVYLAALLAFILMGVISLAPEIIKILAGEQYMEAVWIVPPVAMSVLLLFYSQLFINVSFYYEEKGEIVYASIAAALFNIVLNGILLPRIGYFAAGYTTLISYALFAMANYYSYRKILKKHHIDQKMFDIKKLILILLIYFVLAFTAMVLYNLTLVRCVIVIAVLCTVAVNYKKIVKIVRYEGIGK